MGFLPIFQAALNKAKNSVLKRLPMKVGLAETAEVVSELNDTQDDFRHAVEMAFRADGASRGSWVKVQQDTISASFFSRPNKSVQAIIPTRISPHRAFLIHIFTTMVIVACSTSVEQMLVKSKNYEHFKKMLHDKVGIAKQDFMLSLQMQVQSLANLKDFTTEANLPVWASDYGENSVLKQCFKAIEEKVRNKTIVNLSFINIEKELYGFSEIAKAWTEEGLEGIGAQLDQQASEHEEALNEDLASENNPSTDKANEMLRAMYIAEGGRRGLQILLEDKGLSNSNSKFKI